LIAIHTNNGAVVQALDVGQLSIVDVDQFYGLEIAEWPVRIAEVGLWLADHQANQELAAALGQSFRRLPLKASPTLRVANALTTDWREFLSPNNDVYVLGNPPFVGHHLETLEQKADQHNVLAAIQARGVLDYVGNWYVKAADYIQDTAIRCALVSTNSITQGEQAGILWNHLFQRYRLVIQFAHRTFKWESEARGKAHVHVVIIGFGCIDRVPKYLYDYDGTDGLTPTKAVVSNISPYLVDGPSTALDNRSQPLCSSPKMIWGSKPTDGGHLILTPDEREMLVAAEPGAAHLIRRYTGASEYLNGIERYCLWLADVSPNELRSLPLVLARVKAVREFRLASEAPSTRQYADRSTLFRQIAQPKTDYLIIPLHSSEARRYIPIGFMPSSVIASNACSIIPDANGYHFGILCSAMHMAWVRTVCGRLKSDYRYSSTLVGMVQDDGRRA
jgi:hypothetical protein